ALVDNLFRSLPWLPCEIIDWDEIVSAIMSDILPQRRPSVEDIDLPKQVHQPVRCRGAGQADATFKLLEPWLEELESLGLWVLHLGELIHDQHVHPPLLQHDLKVTFFNQPREALEVDDVDVGVFLGPFTLLLPVEDDDLEVVELLPLADLPRPDAIRHAEGCDD